MRDIDYSVQDDISAASSTARTCSICGKRLSKYNKLGRCFHHPDPEKKRKQRELQARREASVKTIPPAVPSTTESLVPEDTEIEKEPISAERLIVLISELFGVSRAEIEGGSRQGALVRARHVLMYLLYNDTSFTYPAIGALIGGRDHTTVIHGVSKITHELETDPELQNLIRHVRSRYLPPIP